MDTIDFPQPLSNFWVFVIAAPMRPMNLSSSSSILGTPAIHFHFQPLGAYQTFHALGQDECLERLISFAKVVLERVRGVLNQFQSEGKHREPAKHLVEPSEALKQRARSGASRKTSPRQVDFSAWLSHFRSVLTEASSEKSVGHRYAPMGRSSARAAREPDVG